MRCLITLLALACLCPAAVAQTAPDLSLQVDPGTVSIVCGQSITVELNVTSPKPQRAPVATSCTGLPVGLLASFGSPSIVVGANNSGAGTLTLSASPSMSNGSYSVVVIGASGDQVASSSLKVTVTAANPPDFGLTAEPISVTQGASTQGTITIASINGFGGALKYALDSLPPGVTASVGQSPGAAPITILAAADAPLGSSTMQVTATSGSLTHTLPITITVVAPQVMTAASITGHIHRKIVLLVGQSNAQGMGSLVQLPPVPEWAQNEGNGWTGAPARASSGQTYEKPTAANDDTLFIDNNAKYVVPATFSQYIDQNMSEFGPEVSLIARLKALHPSDHYVLVKCVLGGSAVEKEWAPPAGQMLVVLQKMIAQAQDQLSASGDTYEWYAAFWHQGENGAASVYRYQNNIETFRDATETLFTAIRSMTRPTLPIVTGRISNSMLAKNIIDPMVGKYTADQLIAATQWRRAQQVDVAEFNPDGTHNPTWDGKLKGTVWVDEDNLQVDRAKNVNPAFWYHFTSVGYLDLGERDASAFEAAFK